MKRKITKTNITFSVNIDLYSIVDKVISNKSEYIEYLIYQELLNNKINGIEKIII